MSDIAIRVENLSKRYLSTWLRAGRIGQRERYKALRDTLTDAMYAPFRAVASVLKGRESAVSGQPSNTYIWALKDVSFEVQQGEVVGIPSTGSGQASAAMGRGRPRLLRQAQYKAQGSLPHHRADGGLRRDPRPGGVTAGGGHRLLP